MKSPHGFTSLMCLAAMYIGVLWPVILFVVVFGEPEAEDFSIKRDFELWFYIVGRWLRIRKWRPLNPKYQPPWFANDKYEETK